MKEAEWGTLYLIGIGGVGVNFTVFNSGESQNMPADENLDGEWWRPEYVISDILLQFIRRISSQPTLHCFRNELPRLTHG